MVMIAAAMALAIWCAASMTGCASAPGKFEEAIFTRTNVPMLTVHSVTNFVTVTNVVPKFEVQIVQVTNAVGVVVPTFETNRVLETNYVREAIVTPAGSTVMVPQFTGRTAAGDAAISGAGAMGGMFGYGGIVVAVLSGLTNWWQKSRNQSLAAKYTGASQGQAIANQASAALVQNVETLLEVLKTSPQGQAILPTVKNYLTSHQLDAGVIDVVATLVDEHVDNEAARDAAAEIVKAVNVLKA